MAASFAVAGLGSDTGNSIRGPSSHLALFGIRSTLGLTSRDGVIPLAWDRDIAGPMTRTVADGARIFDVVAGYDPADAMTELGRGRRESDYTAFLRSDGLNGARLGVVRELARPEESDPEILALFEQALGDLAAAGAQLVDPFPFPELEQHLAAEGLFCPRFRYDMYLYLQSRGPRSPIRDVMEVLESGQYSPYIEERLRRFARLPPDVPPEEWEEPCPTFPHHPGRLAYLEGLVAAMDAAQVDAVVYPTWTHPPAPLERAVEEYRGDNSQLIAPATGTPAVTVPMGFSYGRYPAGLQILGRPYAEGRLFELAYAYEQATEHRRPPADFPALPPDGERASR